MTEIEKKCGISPYQSYYRGIGKGRKPAKPQEKTKQKQKQKTDRKITKRTDLKIQYFLQGKVWYCDNLCFILKLFEVLFIPNELQRAYGCVWISLPICVS